MTGSRSSLSQLAGDSPQAQRAALAADLSAQGGQRLPAPRVPPHNLDAEAAVLSACMLDPVRLEAVRERLDAADFYSFANRHVWESMCTLADSGRAVDVVTIATDLDRRGRLQQLGGTPYLSQLCDATPAVAHVLDHARLVSECAYRRRLIEFLRTVAAEAYDPSLAARDHDGWREALPGRMRDV